MEVNFYEMYLEEMALIPVLEAEEEEKVLALAATGDKEAKNMVPSVGEWIWLITEPSSGLITSASTSPRFTSSPGLK